MIDKSELLLVVDEDNNPIDKKPRQEVHQNNYWHRTAHIWVINDKKQILCQQRSLLKDSNPGKWEPFFGGHIGPDTSYVEGALTEMNEELNLTIAVSSLVLWEIYKHDRAKEFMGVFILSWSGKLSSLKLEKDEINQVKWVSLEEVRQSMIVLKLDNWSYMGYEDSLLPYIESLK